MNAPDLRMARDCALAGTHAATRTIAVVASRKGDGERVGNAFSAEGWGQVHVFAHPDALLRALALGLQVDLVVMGLHFSGLDGLGLLRELVRYAPAPAVQFYSYQQMAVRRAAGALAQALGLRYLGSADATSDARELARTLDQAWPQAASKRGFQPRPALARGELRGLLDQQRMRAYLQPKVRIDSGEVTGFEVLMRATGPDGQLITPDRLIEPLAQSGWLCEATRQLFVPALDVLGECLSEGFPVSISFNASLGLIALPGFGAALARQVEQAGLDPSWITIEITETEAMSSPVDVMEHGPHPHGRLQPFH
jgi:CheY-like chemotaxis protein